MGIPPRDDRKPTAWVEKCVESAKKAVYHVHGKDSRINPHIKGLDCCEQGIYNGPVFIEVENPLMPNNLVAIQKSAAFLHEAMLK